MASMVVVRGAELMLNRLPWTTHERLFYVAMLVSGPVLVFWLYEIFLGMAIRFLT